jgi:hypothetical protein
MSSIWVLHESARERDIRWFPRFVVAVCEAQNLARRRGAPYRGAAQPTTNHRTMADDISGQHCYTGAY